MQSKQQFQNSLSRTIALPMAIVLAMTVVFTQPAQAQAFEVIHSFGAQSADGRTPDGLTVDGARNLYGTTQDGGQQQCDNDGYGCGTVFNLSHQDTGWVFATLYKFTGLQHGDGRFPGPGVIFGPDNSLYGTTIFGGIGLCPWFGPGCGTVFKLTPPNNVLGNWAETVVYRFGVNDNLSWGGTNPYGPLVFDGAGNLYGTTRSSSLNGGPTVFELSPFGRGWTKRTLSATEGGPSGLSIDNTGNLYGTTQGGGIYGNGTVFQLQPSGSGWRYVVLHSFDGSDGGGPSCNLVFDQLGNLYGATDGGGPGGGGTVFMLSPSNGNWTFSLLYGLSGNGSGDYVSLAVDTAGSLYGTTYGGGAYANGSVYKLAPSGGGWIYASLHDFTAGDDGNNPTSLLLGPDGNLYGTTYSGGIYYGGTVFEITLN